jgi:O-methyltransferase
MLVPLKRQLLDIDNVDSPDMLMRRTEGLDWPAKAETMIGLKRMDNILFCLTEVMNNNIEGDVLEAGVWRGGACIFMKAILNEYRSTKKVFVCDSFEGLPAPEVIQDAGSQLHTFTQLAVPQSEVVKNFEKYGLLDNNVVFVKGWFKDTLPKLKGHKFSLIRLDGDMYKSTMDQLENLYEGVSVGGFIIIDDWAIAEVRMACEEFRAANNITDEIIPIDQLATYWKKTK